MPTTSNVVVAFLAGSFNGVVGSSNESNALNAALLPPSKRRINALSSAP